VDEHLANPPAGAPVARFGPDRRYTWLAAAGALIAAAVAAVAGDPGGRLLLAAAAVLLLGYAVSDVLFTPRLTVSGWGISVRAPLTRADLPWTEIEDVRADTRVRLGLRSTTLEVDGGAVLAVLSRRALGADPEEVAGLARAFRPIG
jgi:PH (Pleckstrin Homology) domain-containing protein